MPPSCISKQPTSSAAPNRFFSPRTRRSDECLSPSKCSTTSTRCSSTRGPATWPSLVTWPTSTVAMPRSLATATSAAVTARTWVTPPGTPSVPGAEMVCTESSTSRPGLDRVEVAEHRAEVGLGGQVEPLVQGADALGPQPHLADRLLAADHQRRAAGAGRPLLGDVEQQRRLADAGLAGEQHHRAGHQAAAEHPVELADAGRPARAGSALIVGDRPGRLGRHAGS